MSGMLYIVATPLGNLEDLSPRAVRLLKEVDLIACEDTRHTRKLLNHFDIHTPMTSYHEHNEETRSRELVELLEEGKRIALVSDAGTPLVSDPGYRLVRSCREQGISVFTIPGPAAAVAALSISGLPTDRFFFAGFLPRRSGAQKAELKEMAGYRASIVFYVSPHGLQTTLTNIREILGNRQAFLVREMTKIHETAYTGTLEEIAAAIEAEPPRGEYTLVVEGQRQREPQGPRPDVVSYVFGLMHRHGLTQKEAIKRAAQDLGLPRREVYDEVVSQR